VKRKKEGNFNSPLSEKDPATNKSEPTKKKREGGFFRCRRRGETKGRGKDVLSQSRGGGGRRGKGGGRQKDGVEAIEEGAGRLNPACSIKPQLEKKEGRGAQPLIVRRKAVHPAVFNTEIEEGKRERLFLEEGKSVLIHLHEGGKTPCSF